MTLDDLPPVLLPREVADVLRLSVEGTRDLIVAGKLKAMDVGKTRGKRPTYRILKSDLLAYLQAVTRSGPSADASMSESSASPADMLGSREVVSTVKRVVLPGSKAA